MRKILLLAAICLIALNANSQMPSYQQKLYYTCKVWGFVKYYHSQVSNCLVNWDSVLIANLPAIKNATSDSAFNDILDTMLAAAGPMAIATTAMPDTLPALLKQNRNFSWISDPVFRSDVKIQLDTIRNNFRPHAVCWVENNDYKGSYYGWLVFPYDSTMLNINTVSSFPDESNRLLMLFKHWNIMNYFNPYNYVLDKPVDTILYNNVLNYANAASPYDLFVAVKKMTTSFNDAHVDVLTWSYNYPFPESGYYCPFVLLKYIENKYIAVKSSVTGISVGDEIVSVDGLTTTQWEDSLRPYISAGNLSVFRRTMCQYLLCNNYGTTAHIVSRDSTGTTHTINVIRNTYPYSSWFPQWYYPDDSLNSINWTKMNCGVGYINNANLSIAGADSFYQALSSAPAIIIDIRNYPSDAGVWELADLMYAGPKVFSKFTIPDVTYPGTFFWELDSLGLAGNSNPYNGTIILLFNQETQSAAEFDCMIMSAMPHVIKIGSQTAGADGNVTWFKPAQDMQSGFTTLGVHYPNGDSTQRIGIVPDTLMTPTQAGIRHGRDELLDKALSIACKIAAVQNVANSQFLVKVFPNPTDDIVNIDAQNLSSKNITISITDISGKTLIEKSFSNLNNELHSFFNIQSFPTGVYIVEVKTDGGQYNYKLIKR
jgi:hypothetical protein